MDDLSSREHTSRLGTAAYTLRIDAATAEVMRAFARADIESRLLKGRVIAGWLYQDSPRLYLDSDILVRPDQVQPAGEVLLQLGFSRALDERTLPEWWRTHDSHWDRVTDGVRIDLHSSIPGVGVGADVAWKVLTETTDTVLVGGLRADTLGVAARALHLALHVTHHGGVSGRHSDDLDRGLAQCDADVWRDAAALADRLAATDAFALGLRSTEMGSALASELGLPASGSVQVELGGNAPPQGAMTIGKLAQTRGIGPRAAIVLRKLVPPVSYMKVWAPEAARGPFFLARAYVRRPFWVLRRAPRGLRAYWRARQSVRSRGG